MGNTERRLPVPSAEGFSGREPYAGPDQTVDRPVTRTTHVPAHPVHGGRSIMWGRDASTDPPSGVANFDSATTLLRALVHCLNDEEFPALGIAPNALAPIVPFGNYLPQRARQRLYRYGSAREALDPDQLSDVRVENFREWVVEQYPDRTYPAIMVGSTNGAAVYLAALLGIPWLPQTCLIPVRRDIDPDAPLGDAAWARNAAEPLLTANRDIRIHQMNDPNQDRIPIQVMAYFRVKSLALGPAYERFLEQCLEPGGSIIALDCGLQWPTRALGDRHVFQFGGVGGIDPQEYLDGSDRIERFLASHGSSRRRWEPPDPDADRPEAEWGFAPAMGEELAAFASEHGHPFRRLQYDHPNDLSPLVSRLYRERYESLGIPARRLVVTTFAQMDPWWTLRTGSVPHWLTFMTDPDADQLETFLRTDGAEYDDVLLSLFSHGVESVGLAGIDRWRSILDSVHGNGSFLGVDPDTYPVDFGTYVRYNREFPHRVPDRHPLASPMPYDRFEAVMADFDDDRVRWILDSSRHGST